MDQENPESATQSSFSGTLKLQEFMYTPTEPVVRRSRRAISQVATSTVTTQLSSSKKRPSQDTTANLTREDDEKSPKKKKNKNVPSGYAPPSMYAHLNGLPDRIADDLILLFIGLNPGIQTARTGHAYAHPTNLFWKLLFTSGITPRPCKAEEDQDMPALYSLGLTNIVARPSRNGAELHKKEMDEGVAILEEKAAKHRPEAMCIVGKSIWESIWRVKHGKNIRKNEFRYGWQDDEENMGIIDGEWEGAKVFVASSTSGLAATLSPADKQKIWDELGTWVKQRRLERQDKTN
ncbi:hypothetical protein Golomagni_07430 [Golovinomyces magnicellulatus]|nr:hypothetical protein Golomagni_07430 [Golovinomyces magnicellulatus]